MKKETIEYFCDTCKKKITDGLEFHGNVNVIESCGFAGGIIGNNFPSSEDAPTPGISLKGVCEMNVKRVHYCSSCTVVVLRDLFKEFSITTPVPPVPSICEIPKSKDSNDGKPQIKSYPMSSDALAFRNALWWKDVIELEPRSRVFEKPMYNELVKYTAIIVFPSISSAGRNSKVKIISTIEYQKQTPDSFNVVCSTRRFVTICEELRMGNIHTLSETLDWKPTDYYSCIVLE